MTIQEQLKRGNNKPLTDYIIDGCLKTQTYVNNQYMYIFYAFILMFSFKLLRKFLLKFNIKLLINIPYNIPIILKGGEFDILNELADLCNIFIYFTILNYALYIILR